MDEVNVPIFQKAYDFHRLLHSYRNTIPKQDRYTTWLRCENLSIDILEQILLASQASKAEKAPFLSAASAKVNLLRILVRLAKDTKAIDNRKYMLLQELIDEIGRMLGGWIKSSRDNQLSF